MTDPRLEALRATRLAAELTDRQAQALADVLTLRDLKAGDVLVQEGSTDSHLYVIVKGVLGVVKNAGTPEAVTLHTLSAGDFVDELGFIDGTPYYASKVAMSDLTVLGLARERLEGMLREHPEVVYRVMRAIVRHVHQVQHRLSAQAVELTNYITKTHGRY